MKQSFEFSDEEIECQIAWCDQTEDMRTARVLRYLVGKCEAAKKASAIAYKALREAAAAQIRKDAELVRNAEHYGVGKESYADAILAQLDTQEQSQREAAAPFTPHQSSSGQQNTADSTESASTLAPSLNEMDSGEQQSASHQSADLPSAMAPVPLDSPLILAWNAYIATEEFTNTKKWAIYGEHVQGSLWAAFSEGYLAAQEIRRATGGKA